MYKETAVYILKKPNLTFLYLLFYIIITFIMNIFQSVHVTIYFSVTLKCCVQTRENVRVAEPSVAYEYLRLLTITRCYKTQIAFCCILHFTFLSLLSEHNQCDTLRSVEGRPGLMSAGNGNLNEFTFALSRIFKAEMSSHSR